MTEEEMKRLNEQIGERGGWEIVNEDNVLDPNFVPQVELKPCTKEQINDIVLEELKPYIKQLCGLQYLKNEAEIMYAHWAEKCARENDTVWKAIAEAILETVNFFSSEINKVLDGSLADEYESKLHEKHDNPRDN